MKECTLILTVGLPRSGKSSWSRKTGHPVVNPDSIRLALHGQAFVAKAEGFVWSITYLMVESLFLAGHKIIIVDATNVREHARAEWKKRFESDALQVVTQVFTTPPEECVRRAKDGGREDLVPVIIRMMNEWDLPVPESWCNAEHEAGQCTGPYRCLHSPQEAKEK